MRVAAACLGATMIEHHYGYAESALARSTQDFPRDYNYNDEIDRFRAAGKVWEEANLTAKERLLTEVAAQLVECGVTMLPTRVVYEANRDILRASSLPWHEKYTHQALINWNLPNPAFHGSYHYDWTSDDEQYWYTAFDLWGDLIYAFNELGGARRLRDRRQLHLGYARLQQRAGAAASAGGGASTTSRFSRPPPTTAHAPCARRSSVWCVPGISPT